MTSTMERNEKEMLSVLKEDKRSGLKVEEGLDHRMRLVLDRGAAGCKPAFLNSGYLSRQEVESLTNEGMFDVDRDNDYDL